MLYTGGANNKSRLKLGHVSALLELYNELVRAFDISAYYFTQSPGSVQLLQGYVIMNTFRASQLAPFGAFSFLPFVIRSAQILQLHTSAKVGDQAELEAGHRLWWHLLYLDMESTIGSGLQSIIRPNSYDIQLLSVLPTQRIPSSEDNTSLQASSPMMVAMQGHWELAHRMHIWFGKMPEHHEIVHFSRIIERLQSVLSKDEESEWARIYLKLQVDRAYCMLSLGSWQLEQFKETACHSEVVR
jgi:hypothetical protein